MTDFKTTLTTFRQNFDTHLEQFLADKQSTIKTYTTNQFVRDLCDYASTLAPGGKRFRPFLVDFSYRQHGGTENIDYVLRGVELFHIFALIHDDFMDHADSRHGVATAHTNFAERYDDDSHLGASQALLLGDLVHAWAIEQFYRDPLVQQTPAAQKQFQKLIEEVIIGQMVDVHMTTGSPASEDEILEKTAAKSAHYSIMHPILIGCILAGGDAEHQQLCGEFGHVLGMAFQIQDDLFDCTGADMGKPVCNDLREGQQTLLTEYMFNQAMPDQRDEFAGYFANAGLTKDQELAAQKLMHDAGAVAAATQQLHSYLDRARQIAREMGDEWTAVVELIAARQK